MSFEKDMMNFILYTLCDEDAGTLYYSPNNISATYTAMDSFKENINKHPLLFKWFFKIS